MKDRMGIPGGSDGKESTCNAGDTGLISGSRRSPGGGNSNPFQYSCLENPMNRRACKESDMTEQLTHTHRFLYPYPVFPHELDTSIHCKIIQTLICNMSKFSSCHETTENLMRFSFKIFFHKSEKSLTMK